MLYSVFEGILIKLFLFKLQCFWLAGPISWVTLQDHVFVANRETCFVSADGDPAGRMCRRSDSQHMSVLTRGGSNWGAGVHHEAARWLKLGWAELTATWTPCVPSSCVGGWVGGWTCQSGCWVGLLSGSSDLHHCFLLSESLWGVEEKNPSLFDSEGLNFKYE